MTERKTTVGSREPSLLKQGLCRAVIVSRQIPITRSRAHLLVYCVRRVEEIKKKNK